MTSTPLYLYCARRLLQAIPLLVGVIVVNFTIIHVAPGDPVTALVGDFPAPPAYVTEVRKTFGLDQPAWKQLSLYIVHVARGDLGYSFAARQPVLNLVMQRLGATALLTGSAMLIALIIGLTLGILSSLRPYSWLDNVSTGASLIGYSVPVFWLGQVLIVIFAVKFGWLPTGGMRSLRGSEGTLGEIGDRLKYLLLPAFALFWRYLAVNTRITRSSMLEVLSQDYVTTARAKGLATRAVILRHALRNALLPIITILGFQLGFLLAGSALVETVFSWPGIGSLLYRSITLRDYPVILGIFLVVSVMVVIANLIADVLAAVLDPRIRY